MNINRLVQMLAVVTVLLCLAVFGFYYLQQRDRLAELILDSLREDLAELTYMLSRNLNQGQATIVQQALVDRSATINDFILAITVFEGDRVLLRSDPRKITRPQHLHTFRNNLSDSSVVLDHSADVTGVIRYYRGAELINLDVVFFLDHDEMNRYLDISRRDAFIAFGIFPLLLWFLLSLLIRGTLIVPLARLRQFAYYHDRVPGRFFVRELEAIRYTLRDTFTRLESEQEALYEQARRDALSGLSNRYALQEYVGSLISEFNRTRREFAFVYLDFDNFKSINDSLGHEYGDEIIKEAAFRLRRAVRDYDLVSRVGGDEFVVVLKGYDNKEELSHSIQRIQDGLCNTVILGDSQIQIGSSAGVAIFPHDGQDFSGLMKNADIAMFAAKDQQKGGFRFFSEELNKKVQRNIALDKAMRKALQDGQFRLHYQPKINIQDKTVEGAEALLRWIHPDGSSISPAEFIPVAENNGFIVELGDWVLREAVRQLSAWNAEGIPIVLSVNIATRQFLDDGFESKLISLLAANDILPGQLDLEITEYLLFEQTHQNQALLNRLHDSGFSLSLDDFGTGYSSLSYLKQFAIDQIKIDRSFVSDYQSPSGAVFIDSIIRLGHALGKRIVAEGVETEAQLAYLRTQGCNTAQGFLFAQALEPAQFIRFYRQNKQRLGGSNTDPGHSSKKAPSAWQ